MSKNIYFCPAGPGDEIDFPAGRFKDEDGNFVSGPGMMLNTRTKKINTVTTPIKKDLITLSTPKNDDLDACICSKGRSRCSDDQYCGKF